MTFSKTFLKIALFATTLTGLAGCKDGNLFKEEKSGSLETYENQAKQASFYVDSLSAVATPETVFDELGKPKVRSYNFTACIKDVSQRGVLFFQTWNLSDGKTTRTLKADQAGCIFWPEEISFDYWGPEKFFPMVRTLEAQAGQVGKREFTFWINPWAASVRYQAQNMVDIPVEQRATPDGGNVSFNGKVTTYSSNSIEKVRTTIPEIKLTFTGQSLKDYEIDKLLQLKVAHRYILQFTPSIRRRSITDPNKEEKPTQGKFKLSFILFKDNGGVGERFNAADYVASFEHIVEFDKDFGRALKESVLKFPDIVGLVGRMRVLARLEFMLKDPSPYLDRPTFEGVLEGLPGSSINLTAAANPALFDSAKTMADNVEIKATQIKTAYELLRSSKGIKILSDSDFSDQPSPRGSYLEIRKQFVRPISNVALQNLIDKKADNFDREQVLRAFYNIIAKDYNIKRLATTELPNETKHLRIVSAAEHFFVETLNSNQPVLDLSERADTSIPGKLSIRFSQTEDINFSWAASASVSTGLQDLGALDLAALTGVAQLAPIKASVNGSWSTAYSRNTKKSVGYERSIDLTSRKRSFLVDANVRHCRTIVLDSNPSIFQDEEIQAQVAKHAPFSYMHCDKNITRRILKESYFYIVDNINTTDSWVDSKSFSERALVAFVRGQGEYDLLREFWVSGKVRPTFQALNPFDINEFALPPALKARVNEKFPGRASSISKYEKEILKFKVFDYEAYQKLTLR